jgi:hypothetical protein
MSTWLKPAQSAGDFPEQPSPLAGEMSRSGGIFSINAGAESWPSDYESKSLCDLEATLFIAKVVYT